MKKIQVLMSAYNGELYIQEQIDSILKQEDVYVSLLIRDDGSNDGTIAILKNYAERYDNIQYYCGYNVGIQQSFFDLLQRADRSYDYYAFSDQDDYWFSEKLKCAIQCMLEVRQQIPVLYASKVMYANEDLTIREQFSYTISRKAGFGNALLENICMGCTEVFNRELLELVCKHRPAGNIFHDWFMYLSASCFGKVIFDDGAYMLYRQHGNNQIGMQNSWEQRWRQRICHFKDLKYVLSSQADDFLKCYGEECPQYELVLRVATYKNTFMNRIRLVWETRVYRQQRVDDLIYRILFLAGWL